MLIADTHVHLYPCYDLNAALGNAFNSLSLLAPEPGKAGKEGGAHLAICLTERQDCHFFRQLRAGSVKLAGDLYTVEPCAEDNVVAIRNWEGRRLFVFAGRQIVTSEKLEVLSLTYDADILDGGLIRPVIDRVLAGGGVPVLPWSPGKWFGKRGSIIGDLITSVYPDNFLIGDSALRPIGWGEPGLFLYGLEKGFKIIAGTDPLPFAGDENSIGKYGITCNSAFDAAKPLSEMRRLLKDPAIPVSRVGRRNCPWIAFRRFMANRNSSKKFP